MASNYPLNKGSSASSAWGHWKLNEGSGNAIDSSGNNRNMTEEDSVGDVASGKIGRARGPYASNKWFHRAATWDKTQSLTHTCWVKCLDGSFTGQQRFVINGGGASYPYKIYLLAIGNGASTVIGAYLEMVGIGTSTKVKTGALTTNQWYHIAVTYHFTSPNGYITVWIDGVSLGISSPRNLNGSSSNTTISIGAENGTSGPSTDFYIDDVRTYEKELTNAEILEIYNGGSGTEAVVAGTTSPGSMISAAKLGGYV